MTPGTASLRCAIAFISASWRRVEWLARHVGLRRCAAAAVPQAARCAAAPHVSPVARSATLARFAVAIPWLCPCPGPLTMSGRWRASLANGQGQGSRLRAQPCCNRPATHNMLFLLWFPWRLRGCMRFPRVMRVRAYASAHMRVHARVRLQLCNHITLHINIICLLVAVRLRHGCTRNRPISAAGSGRIGPASGIFWQVEMTALCARCCPAL